LTYLIKNDTIAIVDKEIKLLGFNITVGLVPLKPRSQELNSQFVSPFGVHHLHSIPKNTQAYPELALLISK